MRLNDGAITRRDATVASMLVLLAGSAVSAEPLERAEPPARTVRAVTATRQAGSRGTALQHNLARRGPAAAGDYDLVFDNMTDADSSAGYNVAYVNPGSYDGSNPSSDAYHVGMSSTIGGFYEAPLHPDSGIPMDIWFDEYAADESAWGDPFNTLRTLTMIDIVPVICPAQASDPTTHDWILFWGNVNYDGDLFRGGFEITWASVSSTYCGWFGNTGISLLHGGLEFDIDAVGWIVCDWREDLMSSDEGAGMTIAGGDLLDDNFPAPEDQWTLGETDFTTWIASDGVTGVDPGWDGDPGDTSYLDVINGSSNINLAYVDNPTSPTSELAHDFPFRLYVDADGTPQDPPYPCADINGDGDVNMSDGGILLADFGCVDGYCPGDLDGDGDTDQADLAWFLIYWECGSAGRPPCGPCEPWGSGTVNVFSLPVDNSSVGPGDDSSDPDFNGGVTHFTFDLIVTVTDDNKWTTQSSLAELTAGGVEFYQHPDYDAAGPQSAIWTVFPTVEFDSFWSGPDFSVPGFAGWVVTTPTELEATWFGVPWHPQSRFTSQRITIVIDEDSGIVPAALLSDCNDLFPVLGYATTDATSDATGADFLHREFDIVDAAHPDCPGDVDGDADVDQADLGMLLSAYGVDDDGDLDGDGDTDQADLGILLAAYGTMCGDDCNDNGIVDLVELVRGDALDLNGNCILDECE